MEPCKNPGLVAFVTQPGATFETFDESRCLREVVLPARALLQEGVVYAILFVIMCDPEHPPYEVAEDFHDGREGGVSLRGSPHYITPTSRFLLKKMLSERDERLFEYLNIKGLGEFGNATAYALRFLQVSQGRTMDAVVVCPGGNALPTPDEMREFLKNVGKGETQAFPATVAV